MKNDDFNVFVRTVVKRLLDMSGNKNDIRFSGKTTPTEFEKLVVEASKTVIMENGYVCSMDYVEGGHAFPDIVYNFDGSKYGIEVKSSTNANSPERDDYSARISYWLNMIHCHLEENRQSETGKDFLNALIDKISRP